MEGEADPPLFSLFPYSPLPHPSSPSQRPKSSLWRLFSSEALSLSKNGNGSSTTAIPSTISILSSFQSRFSSFLGIFGFDFLNFRSLDFRMYWMHTSLSSGFLAVSAFACHQRSGLPITTRRYVFNTHLRVDLTRGRVSPTRRLVRPLSHRSTSILLLCQSSGSLSGSWARASLTIPLLLMYRTVKISYRGAASSGQSVLFENGSSGDKSKDVSRLGIQQGKPSAQDKEFCARWSSTSRNLLLLVFGHLNLLFSLLLLSVALLSYFPVTCLFWLLLIPIHLGYELLIRVVSFRFRFGNLLSIVTVHQDLHGFYKRLFRCL
jgi:hypothetical protein